MSEMTVSFLGKDYSFPEEVEKYVVYLQGFENIYHELSEALLSAMGKEIRNGETPGVADIETTIKEKMRQKAKMIIPLLSEDGIYDVTEKDLVDCNKGYIHYEKVYNEMMQGLKANLLNAMEEFVIGMESANRAAYSQVTGSGVSMYSSSLLDHLAFMAYEHSTVKQQCLRADIEYNKAMCSLNARLDSECDRKNAEVMAEAFIGVAVALRMFVDELLDKYLNKLKENGIFNYSLVKQYSMQRSSEFLGNLEMVDDKAKVLELAFEQCPYNPDIYAKALDFGLGDMDTFITAKKFHQDVVLVTYFMNYCKENTNDAEKIEMPVSIIALYRGIEKKEVLKILYERELNSIRDKYRVITEALESNKRLDTWIRANLVEHPESFMVLSEEDIEKMVEETVNEKLTKCIPEEKYDRFFKTGLLSEKDIRLAESTSENLEEINAEINQKVLSAVYDYKKEVSIRKQKYDEAYVLYESEVTERKEIIKKKKENLNSLGIFAFAKKKELSESIEFMEKELDNFKRTHEINVLAQAIEDMYR